jgi:putative endonuclease
MAGRRSFGAEGEARAARWLEASGYALLARNARAGGVEIDLVAARGDTIVFVEVKARRGRAHGAPEEAVDARKRRRLARGAAAWLHASGVRARRVRFDVIVCEQDPAGAWELRHLAGAFDAAG